MAYTLYIIGIGPGHPDYMVPKGKDILAKSSLIVASERALQDFALPGQDTYTVTGKLKEMLAFVKEELIRRDVVVLVSGDTGYYSLMTYLKKNITDCPIEVVAGISSMTFAFARLQESWFDADLLSFHGRVPPEEKLYYAEGRKLGFLTDKEHNPAYIAKKLIAHGWPSTTRAAALTRLSYEDEEIVDATLADIAELEGFDHAVIIVLG